MKNLEVRERTFQGICIDSKVGSDYEEPIGALLGSWTSVGKSLKG